MPSRRTLAIVWAAAGPALALFVVMITSSSASSPSQLQCQSGGMKSVFVVNVDNPQIKTMLETSILKTKLKAYLPKDQYMVCLTGDQLGQIQAQNIGVTPLHLDRRLSPGLSGDSATPGTQLIAELCDNDDRDLADLVQRLRPQLADLQVALDPVSAKRLKITLNGTTPPVQVARSLIDLLCEIVWVEPKGRIVLH